MGDVIHTLPAVRLLRESFPDAHIGWLIEERWAELLCAAGSPRRGPRSSLRPLVDEVHTVKLKEWGRSLFSLSTWQSIATVRNDVRSVHYDATLDLQGAIRSAILAEWSGAPVIYGSAEPRESPASLWYNRAVVPRGRHVIEQNLSIAEAFAAHTQMRRVNSSSGCCSLSRELPRDPKADDSIERRLTELQTREFVILNPGAGWGAKRWPMERYGEVARGLEIRGIRSILNYGPGEEALVREVEAASGGAARPMKCSITELIALTRRARLFIGGDTGPLHLAAALNIPVVAIYGPTDPARTGPYGTRSVVLRNPESLTSHARREATEDGMLGISSTSVVQAAEKLLAL